MKQHKFTIAGRLPGLNDYTKANRGNAGRFLGNAMKQEAQKAIGWQARAELPGVYITNPVRIDYLWVEPNRKRDPDNIIFAKKFIQDALVEIGILQDDGWGNIVAVGDRWSVDRSNPRIEVTITELEP
jgi:Holliday junction resolvase RusA-like endonuclease